MHAAATSKVENSAQGSSCKLKFVHDSSLFVKIISDEEKKFYNIAPGGKYY